MGGHGHDGAGAVGGQHIVRDEDRHHLAVDRVDGLDAVDADAGLVLVQLGALKVGLAGGLGLVGADLVHVFQQAGVDPLLHVGVFRADDHVGAAEQRVGAGGVDGQHIAGGGVKVDLGAVAAADPVFLLGRNALNVIQAVQVVDQAVGVGGDLEHPLALDLVDHRAAAALTDAVDDLLVGQHDFAAGAVVDGHLLFVGQAVLVQLQKDPLGPLVVVGVSGVDLPVPVKREPQAFELAFEAGHVLGGDDLRVDVVFQGVVLGGQAKGVPAHGVQHVVAALPLFAGHDVQRGVAARMAHVQAGGGRIRELHQRVKLGLGVVDLGVEGMLVLPDLLPFGLYCFEVVFHGLISPQTRVPPQDLIRFAPAAPCSGRRRR